MILLGLLLGCRASPDAADTTGTGDTSASEDSAIDTASFGTPTWTLAQAEESLKIGLNRGILEPTPVQTWFLDLLDVRDFHDVAEDCPPYETAPDDNTVVLSNWEGNCDTGDVYIDGGWIFTETDIATEADETTSTIALFSFVGGDASGRGFAGGGSLSRTVRVATSGDVAFSLKLGGTYQDDAADNWLLDGVDSSVEIEGTFGVDGLNAVLDGGMGIGSDFAIFLSELTFNAATCGNNPSGAFWLRDPSTGWMNFDFGDTCDGCATVSFGDETMGTSCVGDVLYAASLTPLGALAGTE